MKILLFHFSKTQKFKVYILLNLIYIKKEVNASFLIVFADPNGVVPRNFQRIKTINDAFRIKASRLDVTFNSKNSIKTERSFPKKTTK